MIDPASQDLPPSPHTNVPDLIDDYRRQQEALHAQTQEISRRRAEILAAAEIEASRIVTTARAGIRGLIVDARRELLALASQVEKITKTADGSEAPDAASTRNRLIEARHDVRRALDEAAPDLEHLRPDAIGVHSTVQPIVQPGQPVVQPIVRPTAHPGADVGPIAPAHKPWAPPPRHSAKAAIGAFVLTGLVIVLGTAWWVRGRGASESRTPATAALKSALEPRASDPRPAKTEPQVHSEVAPRSALSLLIETRRPTWIRATIDGRADAGRMFRLGERNVIDAERDVLLRVGDAGAVVVARNGAEPEALGRDGEVVTRLFERDQASRSAAAITARSSGVPTVEPSSTAKARSPAALPSAATLPAVAARTSSSALTATAAPVAHAAAPSAPRTSAGTPPGEPPRSASPELTKGAEQWLDAYYRREPPGASGSASDVKVSDERKEDQRLPAGLSAVRRTLERVTFQFAGESAILTARMTEGADVGGQMVQYGSWVSQLWIHEADRWRLLDVRIVSDTKLK